MGPFPASFGNEYFLVAVDYVSKWVEAKAIKTNDHKVVMSFIQEYIFSRFGFPRAIISDGGYHFRHWRLEALLKKYSITHKVATPYNPQTSGQVEVGSTRRLKLSELEELRNDAYESSRIYKDRTKAFHDKHIVRKSFEPNQRAAKKEISLDSRDSVFGREAIIVFLALGNTSSAEDRAIYLALADEEHMKGEASKTTKFEKGLKPEIGSILSVLDIQDYAQMVDKAKTTEDRLKEKAIRSPGSGKRPSKLHSRWDDPYIVKIVFPHGAIDVVNPSTSATVKVNGQRLKPYIEMPVPVLEGVMDLHKLLYLDD
ncbi:uncharacterized protein LOC122665396 [Telopea speciosissima]|uniref:uncharacterized protein LOC122665396 n=1 Tax=Telopea speciosissima TaxID=54955 RepID=UPI001CC622A9|nr:uncharacterized protein LOC122665396 [Telopea speciosissima]